MFFSPQFRNSSVCVGVLSCNQQQLTTSYHSNDNFHWQTLFLFCFFLFCFFPIKQSNRFNSILFCFLSRRRWWWFEYLFQFRFISIRFITIKTLRFCCFSFVNWPLSISYQCTIMYWSKERANEWGREREREREREKAHASRNGQYWWIVVVVVDYYVDEGSGDSHNAYVFSLRFLFFIDNYE